MLVTGGAGFIGSMLGERLLASRARLTVVDDLNPFYDPSIKRRNLDTLSAAGSFGFVEADIRNRRAMSRLFDAGHFDAVVHLAAMAGVRPSIERPELYVSVNLDGTCVLLDEAVRTDVGRFLFASSSSVYGNNEKVPFHEDDPVDHPISPYAATKKAGELLAHTYHHLHGLPVTCLRFFTVYGPRQRPEMAIHRFCHLIARGEPVPLFGDGSSSRDYTWIEDIIDGVMAALDGCDAFRIYNLGGSRTTTLARLVDLLEEALGRKAIRDWQPARAGDVTTTFADVGRAQRELGYEPAVPIEAGIRRFVDWFGGQG